MKVKASKSQPRAFHITNRERCAVAHWMMKIDWAGTEESLLKMDDILEVLGLEEYREHMRPTGPGQVSMPLPLMSETVRSVHLDVESAQLLLTLFPGAKTPADLSRAKVSLLRKLRKFVPQEAPPASETPAPQGAAKKNAAS